MAHLHNRARAAIMRARTPLDIAVRLNCTSFQLAAVAFLASGIVGVLFARAGW